MVTVYDVIHFIVEEFVGGDCGSSFSECLLLPHSLKFCMVIVYDDMNTFFLSYRKYTAIHSLR